MSMTEIQIDGAAAAGVTERQLVALALAGTVAVPSPFPSLAQVNVSLFNVNLAAIEDLSSASRSELAEFLQPLLLEVVHEVNPRLTMTRLVKLADVAAIFVPDNARDVEMNQGKWVLERDLGGLVLTALEKLAEPCEGQALPAAVPLLDSPAIVYLPEAAKLMLRVETGMTAAESVEYYPPTPSDRSREFRAFCGGGHIA